MQLAHRHSLGVRLSDAVVTPCALYGLTAAPMTAAAFERLAVAQRKMLRLMVGNIKDPEASWADMYRSLSAQSTDAFQKFSIKLWKMAFSARKERL